nr:YeeE/YedE family protein [uncultured Aquabacterium sp.]
MTHHSPHHPHPHHAPHPPAAPTRPWHGFVIALVCGLLFGWGLLVSGMSNPLVVQAFLDVAGAWNPSLAFVMGGAVGVTLVGFHLLFKHRHAPICGDLFHVPQNKVIDRRLLIGAALFGVGWGLSGYCPGPAINGLMTGNPEVWWFVPAMFAGAWLQRRTNPR